MGKFNLSVVPLALCALLLGCTSMTDSLRLDTRLSKVGSTCQGDLGAYQLPRRLVRVVVTAGTNTRSEKFDIKVTEGKFVADKRQTFCLDFLSSGFAEERIGIARDGTLLTHVFTRTSDKTHDVAKKLVQAGADLAAFSQSNSLARKLAFETKDPTNALRIFEFDPMSEADARAVNDGLRPFGYCLYLKKYSDPFAPDWSSGICDDVYGNGGSKFISYRPTSYEPPSKTSGLDIIDDKPVSRSVQQRGILYRPLLTHTMVIMKQDNPGIDTAPWFPAGSIELQLPNASPPFLLKIKRALFVEAKTEVKLYKGMVQSIQIHKPSELLILSKFTVQVVQIVQNIPKQALKIFNNKVDNQIALMQINQDLIKQLKAENEARKKANLPLVDETPVGSNIGVGRSFREQNLAIRDAMGSCLSSRSAANAAKSAGVDHGTYCRKALETNR